MKAPLGITIKILIVIMSAIFGLTVLIVGSEASRKRVESSETFAATSPGTYAKHCATCHGADGRARTAKGKRAGATDFTGSDWNTNEARGIRIITNGRGEMPSFKGKLSAREIRSVWNHVLKFRQ